jgi:hypothetical protein
LFLLRFFAAQTEGKMNLARRLFPACAVVLLWLAAASAGAQPQALINQAINAMGGEAALAESIVIRGSD